jgi:maltose O-acetyltransferase
MFQDNNFIEIGSNCLIGPSVQLYTAIHPIDPKERIIKQGQRTSYLTKSKPVMIGDNCWIGGNSVVLPGVTIGNNVTIGAGSVVTKDIPSDVIAFDNPCNVNKKLR